MVLLYILVDNLKMLINIPRPFFSFTELNIISQSFSASMSFPSRHATFAFFLLALLPSLIEKRKNANLLYLTGILTAFLISISRIVLGVHYPSDIIAGMVLGFVFGKVTLLYKPEYFSFNFMELKRQTLHLILGLIMTLVLLTCTKQQSIAFVFLIIVIIIIVEYIYTNKKFRLHHIMGELKREQEPAFEGALYLPLGTLITIIIFPKIIAIIAILLLAVGDSFATIFGTHFKTKKLKFSLNKSIGGSLGGFLFNFLALLILFNYNKICGIKTALFLFLCAFAGTIAEIIEIKINKKTINDNISLPLICATLVLIIYLLFGFST
ncbi:MAG: phosphatase PAP2 family protein, partial [Candidatus Aenigmarchaeota archaeon]|nr:phosphatase PAP2 family protein [Candidatus Aenigmarchaeota archaeon]